MQLLISAPAVEPSSAAAKQSSAAINPSSPTVASPVASILEAPATDLDLVSLAAAWPIVASVNLAVTKLYCPYPLWAYLLSLLQIVGAPNCCSLSPGSN